MLHTKGYVVHNPTSSFEPFEFDRRDVGDRDILIEIAYCGICHSDLHQVRNEWGTSMYPMVPGHEIVGRVSRIGKDVKKFKVGDLAGVGCLVDSCRTCENCKKGLEQFCAETPAWTYNGTEMDRKTPTFGGYSKQIVVDKKYALKLPAKLNLEEVAPLLCAGITTYSPLRYWNTKKGDRVGVLGLGGLGHMAVKLAAAMGAEVTMLSSSVAKEVDARRLGAHEFALTSDENTYKRLANYFNLIIDTVSAPHDLNKFLGLLRVEGTLIMLGVPPKPAEIGAFSLVLGRRNLSGSLIGGIDETQEMLDFCGAHAIAADVETIPIQQIGEAYERMLRGDVRYRFVIDMATL